MIRKRVQAAVAGMAIAMVAPAAQAQYTTDWLDL